MGEGRKRQRQVGMLLMNRATDILQKILQRVTIAQAGVNLEKLSMVQIVV